MESRLNKKRILCAGIIMVIIGYFLMTPIGALRGALIMSGHPVSAFTMELESHADTIYTEENQIGYSLQNPPVERMTEGELANWIVTRYGIFYIGQYYGNA